jgi:uncharacterized protein YbgA (DUF1722 family)
MENSMEKIRLGISSCLLGENVRYDGGHRHDRFLTDTLGQYVEYIPVCPEVGCGLPVPREAIRLEGEPDSPRLMTIRTRQDMTSLMETWSRKRVKELEKDGLCGFIFKSDSPSCGMERIKVYNEKGDPILRENFIERIFVFKKWREMMMERQGRGRLVDFHARHKLLILSHSPGHCRLMGRLIAKANEIPIKELYGQYQSILMEALLVKATPKKNANVLMHIMGYFKKELTSGEKQELLDLINNYREGRFPLIVPVTLIRHYVRKYNQPYLKEQVYLNPHPLELQLRNHV